MLPGRSRWFLHRLPLPPDEGGYLAAAIGAQRGSMRSAAGIDQVPGAKARAPDCSWAEPPTMDRLADSLHGLV
jgi:hypothetical protein